MKNVNSLDTQVDSTTHPAWTGKKASVEIIECT